jgi:copper(I)-binding protein
VTKPLGAYETFPLKLTFARAGTVTVDVMVEE